MTTHGIHDYTRKLRQPGILPEVVPAARARAGGRAGSFLDALAPTLAEVGGPLSINLDLTVACNYTCTHCIDLEMLNTRHRYRWEDVLDSLVVMTLAGLRSVILIGGGEPTLHPQFRETVAAIKQLGLGCAIVSNGSNNLRIAEVAPFLEAGDWVRLSLDAGTDETFAAMHNPASRRVHLKGICETAEKVREANPEVSLGFSYIVSWPGAEVMGRPILENVDEMAPAAELAKRHRFDYISFKPILSRDYGGAETIHLPSGDGSGGRTPFERIREQLARAKELEDDGYRVFESVNLLALEDDAELEQSRRQPRVCRMHLLRQVLTAVGVFGCPVYRNNPKDKVEGALAYRSVDDFLVTRRRAYELMESFDASHECRNVTCLYNSTNWWLEDLAGGDVPQPAAGGGRQECFL
jgi:pyruvate-formate lyase-activating enzyme